MKKLFAVVSVVILILTGCASAQEGIWESALYAEDTALGNGATDFVLKVTADGKTVELTVSTDKATVGEALVEAGVIAGENGLYNTVNGMELDYAEDGMYWSFSVNGEYSLVGADDVNVAQGEVYEFTASK